MKIEQILVLHLFNNKELTLQGIGHFTLDPSVSAPQENDKDIVLPQNSVSFSYNPKATEDDALINTIVQNSKKIKPLASADLDSYLILGRQFLNIGKPFTIEGLGTLDKTQAGTLEFIPGVFITPKITPPKALKENEGEVISGLFQDHDRNRDSDNGKKTLVILLVVLLIAIAGWAIWHFVFQKENEPTAVPVQNTTPIAKDSVVVSKDTTSQIRDSISRIKTVAADTVHKDGFTFKVVFKSTSNKELALKSMAKMKSYGHKVIMYQQDSLYKVAEPFKRPLSDTTRIKDSLNKYYYLGKAYIQL